jgi:ankyrin repeat/BTB/POZ domain-containing protein 1
MGAAAGAELSPDIVTLYVEGTRPIHAHRVILAARSPLFRRELTTKWRRNREALTLRVTYGYYDMSFQSMYSLVRFFYSDRLEVPTEDIEDLARLCQICECEGLLETIDSLFPRKHPDDGERHLVRGHPQKRFVLQRRFAPGRLSSALGRLLQDCLTNSREEEHLRNTETHVGFEYDDLADIRVKAGGRSFRCHKMILASRSEYFKARLSRRNGFLQVRDDVLEEHDVSAEAFEKMLVYVYTGELEHLSDGDPLALAEELLDVASRYLLFQLKPVVADLLLLYLDLDHASPAQLCRWVTLSDMYDVPNIREHCLDIIACNFEAFAEERDFRALLLTQIRDDLLNDLRKRWLGVAAAGLDCRDYGSALQFERLEMLVPAAEQEANDDQGGGSSSVSQ